MMSFKNLIDSHIHLLSMEDRQLAVDKIISEAENEGFSALLDVSIDNRDILKRTDFASRHSCVHTALGLAPSAAASDDWILELEKLDGYISQVMPCALGEIGLDYHWNYGSPEKQKHLFASQIRLANDRALPVIIHNRKADSDVLSILKEIPPLYGGIMHCFSADKDTAVRFLELGMKLSFAGNTTYRQSGALREAAAFLPLHSILVETDSPFLPPEGFRGKPNSPLNVAYVYTVIAELRGISIENLVEAVKINYFGLIKKRGDSQ
ncbi:MAG: TatD family deoxyribonuclease [Spirochaetales bacterium]|nr:MAG: TatD family deoxyribonuclease [Spirochaetales bacterium]